MGRTPLATALLLVAALVLGACAPGEDAPVEGAATPRDTDAAAQPEETGEPAPGGTGEPERQATREPAPGATDRPVPEALAFQAPLVGGGTFDGAGRDGRDVALWFWAPW